MTTQDYAKMYGLDLPAKVRISKDKTKLCLTDMNEALIVGQHGELLERRSNPWGQNVCRKKAHCHTGRPGFSRRVGKCKFRWSGNMLQLAM